MSKKNVLLAVFTGSVLATLSGCGARPSQQQLAAAAQRDIVLRRGGSLAVYPVSLPHAAAAARQAMDNAGFVPTKSPRSGHREWLSNEDLLVVRRDGTRAWVSGHDFSRVPAGATVIGYLGQWQSIAGAPAYSIGVRNADGGGTLIEIDSVMSDECHPSDYDRFLHLHEQLKRILGKDSTEEE